VAGNVAAGTSPLCLSDVLFFSTGVREVPALGFRPPPSVQFLHEPEGSGQLSRLPKANTCECIVQLPMTHKSYEAFAEAVAFGIRNAHGFGFA